MTFDVRRYGAIGDGITDDSRSIDRAIAAAAQAGGGTVVFPGGVYRCSGLVGRHRVSLAGYGATLVKHGRGASTHILDLSGTLVEPGTPLAADAAHGSSRLAWRVPGGLSPGDAVLVRDGRRALGSRGRNQELNRVAEVTPDGVLLAARTIGDYRIADGAEVVLLRPVGDLTVEGLTFVVPEAGGDLAGGAVFGRLASHVTIRGCSAIGPDDDAGFQFEQSAWITIDGCHVRDGQNCGSLGRGNGIVIGESSHHCLVTHCRTENVSENAFEDNTRHSAFVSNVDHSSHDDSFNTHGSACRHIQIRGNLCVGGRKAGITVGFAGHPAGDVDVLVAENTIVDPGTHGISVAAPADRPNLDIVVQGNSVWRPSRAAPGWTGICVVGSRHVTVVGNRIVGGGPNPAHGILAAESAHVTVRGNSIRDLRAAYGISYTRCRTVTIAANTLDQIGSYNVYAAPPGESTDVVIQGNRADDEVVATQPADLRMGNVWGSVVEA